MLDRDRRGYIVDVRDQRRRRPDQHPPADGRHRLLRDQRFYPQLRRVQRQILLVQRADVEIIVCQRQQVLPAWIEDDVAARVEMQVVRRDQLHVVAGIDADGAGVRAVSLQTQLREDAARVEGVGRRHARPEPHELQIAGRARLQERCGCAGIVARRDRVGVGIADHGAQAVVRQRARRAQGQRVSRQRQAAIGRERDGDRVCRYADARSRADVQCSVRGQQPAAGQTRAGNDALVELVSA